MTDKYMLYHHQIRHSRWNFPKITGCNPCLDCGAKEVVASSWQKEKLDAVSASTSLPELEVPVTANY